jgi:hypothetical protein
MANETQIYVGKIGAQTLYKRLKQLIGRITTYKKVPADDHGHPVESNPDSRTIYLVKDESVVGEDKFFEWIWTAPNIWECIGTTSEPCNSWKQWSEDNGSTGVDNTIYIGSNITLNISSTVALGHDNSATYDNVSEPYESSSNILLGSQNEAIDSKYAFQLGTNNTVDGETNPSTQFPVALNIGNHNEIGHSNNTVNGETVPVKDAEGVNIGKSNYAFGFGINLGQSNRATNAGVSIGESNSSDGSGVSIGRNSASTGCGVALGQNAAAFRSSFAVGYHATATDNSFAIGEGTYANNGGYAIGQRAIAGYASFCVGFGGTYVQSSPTRQATANNAAICIAAGYDNGAYACDNSIILSTHHIADTSPNSNNYADDGSIIVGSRNYATNRAVVIGDNNYGTNYARIIGNNNNVPNSSLVFGSNNDSYGGYGVLIGRSNTINGGTTTAYNAAIGLQNTVEAEAFAIGRENVLGGWSFALGVSNMSSSGRNGHATLLGYNNSSIVTYPREYITKKVNGETVQEKCHSFLVGYKNDGKHWNSILIGAENTSKPATVDTPLDDEEHDDGFTTAIGYRNVVGRNYDFAYGYMSTADGGENVAFQHSSAIGYRNLGMFDSSIKGTGNIALVESKLDVTNGTSNSDTKMFTHNTLINSLWTSATPYTYSYGIHHNVLMSVNASIYGNNGVQGNFIFGGRNGTDDYGSPYNPISINTENAVTNNFIFGNAASGISIGARYGILKNIIVCPELMNIGSDDNITKNVILNSSVNISKSHTVLSNIMHTAAVSGTFGTLNNNIVLGDSVIDSSCASNDQGIYKNVLLNNAKLEHTTAKSFWTGGLQPTGNNVLSGSYGIDVYGCFSLSDGQTSLDNTPILNNCLRVFNFGDNTIVNTNNVTVFGGDNDIKGVKCVFTNGHLNTISSEKTYSDDAPGDIYVMGAKNTVKLIDDSSVSEKSRCDRIYIGGTDNTIQGTLLFENYIFGNGNKLQTPSPIQTLTGAEIHQDQIGNVDVSLFKVDSYALEVSIRNDTGRVPTTVQFAAYWLYPNSVYFVDENVIMRTTAPSGVTTTSINIDVFIEKLKTNIAELNHKFYMLTGYSQYSTNQYGSVKISESIIPSSIVIYTGKRLLEPTYFYKIYDKTVSRVYIDDDSSSGQIGESDTNKYCARNSIIGNNNNIQSNVTDYTIIGLQNTLSNKLGPDVQPSWSNSISSGFIQGNNNEASNGSNIISMGNGNVSTGHNSVAIGCQLISNQWQTVLGKYNAAIDGPNRLASETPQDPTKALLIVGNGYSTKDDKYWQDETYITRSNALELYADGRLKITGDIEAANIPAAPVGDGSYALTCEVTNGVATYRWVPVGLV